MKDQIGNELTEGVFVAVQLDSTLVVGRIHQIIEGGVSMLTPPGQPAEVTPTRIVVMCPVTVTVHPQIPVASNVMALKEPQREPANKLPV